MNDTSFLSYKKTLRWIWVLLIFSFLGLYCYYGSLINIENFKSFIGENKTTVLTLYVLISSLRALFLLPSTPFVILGIALYPDSLFFVFLISLVGIQLGATLMYIASSYLTPVSIFGNQSKKIKVIESKMKKYGNFIIMGWALFPIVPTDLICFVSGSIRYNFKSFFLSILIGESILVGLYLFAGKYFSLLI